MALANSATVPDELISQEMNSIDINSAIIDELFGEDEIPIEKIGFFKRVGSFFRRLFGFKRAENEQYRAAEAYSKFKHFYDTMDKEDPSYLHIRHAATLCDDALRVATQRIKVSARLNVLSARLEELDAFINLTDEEIFNLKRMLERFVALAGERSLLLEKLTDYDASLVTMEPMAEDAWQAIPSIKDAEKHQRALRMDIGYLSGEKEELIYDRADMQKTLTFVRNFSLGVIGVFAFIGVILAFMFYSGSNIFAATTILVLLVMGLVIVLNVFMYRLRREMKLNLRKQQRAIELLNKKSVVYAYYTNFLRYCYKKYKANNSRALENNLNDLESYRHLANRIDTVRNLMYETETNIERFLREKKLGNVRSTMEGFAKTINLEDKKRRFNDFTTEKEASEKTLIELDKRHEEIWDTLTKINATDPSGKVNAILETYMSEAQKLFEQQETDNQEENQEQRPVWKLFDIFAEGNAGEGLTAAAAEIAKELDSNPDTKLDDKPSKRPNSVPDTQTAEVSA